MPSWRELQSDLDVAGYIVLEHITSETPKTSNIIAAHRAKKLLLHAESVTRHDIEVLVSGQIYGAVDLRQATARSKSHVMTHLRSSGWLLSPKNDRVLIIGQLERMGFEIAMRSLDQNQVEPCNWDQPDRNMILHNSTLAPDTTSQQRHENRSALLAKHDWVREFVTQS